MPQRHNKQRGTTRAWTPVTERGKPSTIEFVPYSDGLGGVLRWNDERGIGRVLAFTNGKNLRTCRAKNGEERHSHGAIRGSGTPRRGRKAKHDHASGAMAVRHKQAVRDALSEGKPVPAEVLAEYRILRRRRRLRLHRRRRVRRSLRTRTL